MSALELGLPSKAKELCIVSGSITSVNMRDSVIGVDELVTLLDGSTRPYINFDNASSTPFLRSVLERVNSFAPMYASVGRGSGYKSHVSTDAFDAARATIGQFVGASQDTHAVILGKNTTEALNKLSHCLQLSPDDVVLTSLMEHHSNDLPWRQEATVYHIGLCEDGSLDMPHLSELLDKHGSRVRLVTITGASNVTGFVSPIYDIAEMVHAAGALFAVDAAQLAPHRAIDVGKPDDPRRIDFLAYTGHKMYAPLGIGALVALKHAILAEEPDLVGGGTVDFVTEEDVLWSQLPAREEAGTPNIIGAIGWAQAIDTLSEIGMSQVAEHESALAKVLLSALGEREQIKVFGDAEPANSKERLGVISFSISGVSHKLAAAVLGHEGGIGVRAGLFCAHPYVLRLQGTSTENARAMMQNLRSGKRQNIPGLIRVSFGIYNTAAEIETFVNVLDRISAGDYKGEYLRDPVTGALKPETGVPWNISENAWSPRQCT